MSDLALSEREKNILGEKGQQMYAQLTIESKKIVKEGMETVIKHLERSDKSKYSKAFTTQFMVSVLEKQVKSAMLELLTKLRYMELSNSGTPIEAVASYRDGLRVRGAKLRKNKVNEEVFEESSSWKYNTNAIILIVGLNDLARARLLIKKGLEGFTYFDDPGIEIKKDLNKRSEGQINFNPKGLGQTDEHSGSVITLANDFGGKVGGLTATHNVTVFGSASAKDYDQIAVTHGGHALVGIRKWGHHLTKDEEIGDEHSEMLKIYEDHVRGLRKNGHYSQTQMITIWTQAHETYNNLAGLGGAEYALNLEAKKLWRKYLTKVALGVMKRLKENIKFDPHTRFSPAVLGHSSEYGSNGEYVIQLLPHINPNPLIKAQYNVLRPKRKNKFYEERFEIYSKNSLEFFGGQ